MTARAAIDLAPSHSRDSGSRGASRQIGNSADAHAASNPDSVEMSWMIAFATIIWRDDKAVA
jgi:hypothetical protein